MEIRLPFKEDPQLTLGQLRDFVRVCDEHGVNDEVPVLYYDQHDEIAGLAAVLDLRPRGAGA